MPYTGPQPATTGVVAGTVSSVTLSTGTWNVNGTVIFNASTAVCYLTFGTVSSTTAYTTQIAANTSYAFPAPVYGGPVTAVWSATNGTAFTTLW